MCLETIEKATTRERILQAARKLMSENGFKGATTKMIAKEAGVNEATIFRLFENKEGILLELIGGVETVGRKYLAEILADESQGIENMLYQYASMLYEGMGINKELIFISMMEAEKRADIAELFAKGWSWNIHMLAAKFLELSERGIIGKGDFMTMACIFNQSLLGTFMMLNKFAIPHPLIKLDPICRNLAAMTTARLMALEKEETQND